MTHGHKKKIALVNVFFPPRALGGATRVVADQFDVLTGQYGDKFDCVVFTTSNCRPNDSYTIKVYPYKGVRVYQLNVFLDIQTEWQYNDKKVKAVFDTFLAFEQPDLVHFHCIQRLTASILEAAKERHIPYLVTVHDAWWISDYQFLSCQDGTVYPEGHPDPFATYTLPESITLEASLERKFYLKTLLNDAAKILSVSEKFAEIYRKNGIRKLLVNKNGISPIAWLPKNTLDNCKVICAHIGGMAHHKGYFLFKSCIEKLNPSNIEVLVVDHSRNENYRHVDQWRDVTVTFIGPVPQERITSLYRKIDVLFAPSLWPESFGLVAREASASRCWVVASNLGAIGEDIIEGKSGLVVDVATDEGLCQAIRAINDNPKKFKDFAKLPKIRTAIDQVSELVALYNEVLQSDLINPS